MTYIIVDLEATCCNDGAFPKSEMEIIEIGAVALYENGPEILDEFQSFVKPVRNPILTGFCTGLTSIKQGMVDSADEFPSVCETFSEWLSAFDSPVFCSWGKYDKSQFLQDCEYHSVEYPFDNEHINIKVRFANNIGLKKGIGLEKALRKVGLPFVGRAHRGIDDARNMAGLAPYIFL